MGKKMIYEKIYSETFANNANGWSITRRSTGYTIGTYYGNFAGTGGSQGYYKTFNFGPEHAGKNIIISFDMYAFDSWDNSAAYGLRESFQAFINDNKIVDDMPSEMDYHTTLVDELGNGWGPEKVVHYNLETILDENGSVKLGFGSTLDSNIRDESFGIGKIDFLDTTRTKKETNINVNYGAVNSKVSFFGKNKY